MSYEELHRVSVIERVIEKRLTQLEAARVLGLTSRQVRRLDRTYERDGPVSLDADASMYAGLLAPGDHADLSLDPGRHAWVQVVSGEVEAEVGEGVARLHAGDGAAISDATRLRLQAIDQSEVLVFDLA